MPAPILKHFRVGTSAANTWTNVMGPVAANRCLVISKLTITQTNVNGTFSIAVTTTAPPTAPGFADYLVLSCPINIGEQYTETGLVVPAGEYLAISASTSGLAVGVFCQEVDN